MKTWIGPFLLVLVGVLQMAGDLTGNLTLKAIGAISAASPAPKVFTAQNGFETYSSNFYLNWTDKSGTEHEFKLTPGNYSNVRGPYNRRNAYGAALSYGPVLQANDLTREMHNSALHYTFCGESTALDEIGIDRSTVQGNITMELRPRQALPANHEWQLAFEVSCDAK